MDAKSYVEQRDGGYWVAGTRVSLDSLIYGFREGHTAESLAQSFPVPTLEQSIAVRMDPPTAVVVARGCAGRPVPSPAGACRCVGQR
jgi:hypothetical protein